MFEDKTFDSILASMLANVPDNLDKREGAIIYNALAPAAVELQNAYRSLDWLYQETFPDTASRDGLVKRCAERGVEPYPATKAILEGKLVFKRTLSGEEIASRIIGQRFSSVSSSCEYVVVEYVPGDDVTEEFYKFECSTPGEIGNKYFGQIIPVFYIEDLESSSLTDVLIPGEDEEDTEHLRERYYASLKAQAFGGNRADYIEKTNEIEGVGGTKVYRLTPVDGSSPNVKLLIIAADYTKPSDVLISDVKEIIDPALHSGEGLGLAPIDHIVLVEGVEEVVAFIGLGIEYEDGYTWDDVQDGVTSTIETYFDDLRKSWDDVNEIIVRISQIETRVLDVPRVLDVSGTTINGSTQNMKLTENQIPVVGNIVDNPLAKVGAMNE